MDEWAHGRYSPPMMTSPDAFIDIARFAMSNELVTIVRVSTRSRDLNSHTPALESSSRTELPGATSEAPARAMILFSSEPCSTLKMASTACRPFTTATMRPRFLRSTPQSSRMLTSR